MWTNQYLKENFYNLNDYERQKLGGRYKEEGQKEMHGRMTFVKTENF